MGFASVNGRRSWKWMYRLLQAHHACGLRLWPRAGGTGQALRFVRVSPAGRAASVVGSFVMEAGDARLTVGGDTWSLPGFATRVVRTKEAVSFMSPRLASALSGPEVETVPTASAAAYLATWRLIGHHAAATGAAVTSYFKDTEANKQDQSPMPYCQLLRVGDTLVFTAGGRVHNALGQVLDVRALTARDEPAAWVARLEAFEAGGGGASVETCRLAALDRPAQNPLVPALGGGTVLVTTGRGLERWRWEDGEDAKVAGLKGHWAALWGKGADQVLVTSAGELLRWGMEARPGTLAGFETTEGEIDGNNPPLLAGASWLLGYRGQEARVHLSAPPVSAPAVSRLPPGEPVRSDGAFFHAHGSAERLVVAGAGRSLWVRDGDGTWRRSQGFGEGGHPSQVLAHPGGDVAVLLSRTFDVHDLTSARGSEAYLLPTQHKARGCFHPAGQVLVFVAGEAIWAWRLATRSFHVLAPLGFGTDQGGLAFDRGGERLTVAGERLEVLDYGTLRAALADAEPALPTRRDRV